jgi:hypothetical protein
MANSRISELPLKAEPANDDLIPLVDTQFAGGQTASKKTTFGAFLAGANAAVAGYVAEQLGVPGGIASLDIGTGKVPAEQLPSYVDDVLEYNNLAALPSPGETGKIYVTVDSKKIYRWTGSIYAEISAGTHAHGNITSDGKIGIISGLPIITGTAGILQVGVFGSVAGSFCSGDDVRLSNARTPLAHTHGNIDNAGAVSGAQITASAAGPLVYTSTGTVRRGAFGTIAGSICQGDDLRLSNSRTPSAHASTHLTGGTDAFGAASIAQSQIASTLGNTDLAGDLSELATNATNASNLTSGLVATGRLANTGVASSSTFLRGDSAWSSLSKADVGLSGVDFDAGGVVLYRDSTIDGGAY